MQAGLVRKVAILQKRDDIQDATGAQVVTWTTLASTRAYIEPLRGQKGLDAQVINAEVSHQITLRFMPIFKKPLEVAKMRLLSGDRTFIIHASINKDERNREITLLATEGLNDG